MCADRGAREALRGVAAERGRSVGASKSGCAACACVAVWAELDAAARRGVDAASVGTVRVRVAKHAGRAQASQSHAHAANTESVRTKLSSNTMIVQIAVLDTICTEVGMCSRQDRTNASSNEMKKALMGAKCYGA
eukprot:3782960-Pleurochrysis_carterae.AAC.1